MKAVLTKKEIDKMVRVAATGKWKGLIPVKDIPAFAAWLSNEDHDWIIQSPDAGEALRIYRDGMTRIVYWDGERTVCGRHLMALWHTFECFRYG